MISPTPASRLYFAGVALAAADAALMVTSASPLDWRASPGDLEWIVLLSLLAYVGGLCCHRRLGEINAIGVLHLLALCTLGLSVPLLVLPIACSVYGSCRTRGNPGLFTALGSWGAITMATLLALITYHAAVPYLPAWVCFVLVLPLLRLTTSLYIAGLELTGSARLLPAS